MTDEQIVVTVTDEGSTAVLAAQLELLGLTGEAAADRLTSGFQAMFVNQSRAEANAKLYNAAVQAGVPLSNAFADAIGRMSNAELKSATSTENLTRTVGLLAIAQRDGVEAALAFAQATTAEIQAHAGITAAIEAQATATAGLAARQEAAEAATLSFITTTGAGAASFTAYTVAQTAFTDATLATIAVTEEATASVAAYNLGFVVGQAALAAYDAAVAALSATLTFVSGEFVAARAALTSFGVAATNVGTAIKAIGTTLGGISPVLAGLVAVAGVIAGSDVYQKVISGLQGVTGSLDNAKAAYTRLFATSQLTQTSIEANASLFTNLRSVTDAYKVSTNQVFDAVQGFDVILKANNITGQNATAVTRTFGEIIEQTTGSTKRFSQQLQREAAPVLAALKVAAGELGISLQSVGLAGSSVALTTQQLADKQSNLLAITARAGQDNLELARNYSTVGGAITVLKNAIDDFSGSADSANTTIKLVKDAIFFLADNINTVIPVVLALGAAFLAVKVVTLIDQILTLTGAIFGLLLNPISLYILGAAAAFYIGAVAAAAFFNLFRPANDQISANKIIMDDLKGAVSAVSSAFNDASKSLADSTAKTTDNKTASDAAAKAIDAFRQKQEDQTADTSIAAAGNAKLASSYNGVANAANGAAAAVYAEGAAIKNAASALPTNTGRLGQASHYAPGVSGGISSQTLNNSGSNAITTQDLNGASSGYINNGGAGQYVTAGQPSLNGGSGSDTVGYTPSIVGGTGDIGAGDDPATYTSPTSIGDNSSYLPSDSIQFRDGGSYHVPGGTGVDSKTIHVSPGEVVTVQTPMQYRNNIVPALTSKTRFADGGTTFGAGVDLGTGVSPTDTLIDPSNSVTGFNDNRSTTALQTSTDDNTAATVANTDALTSTSDTTTDPLTSTSTTAANDNTNSTAAITSVVSGDSPTVQSVSNAQKAYNEANTNPGPVVQGGPGRFPLNLPNYVFDANGIYAGSQGRDMFGNLVTSGGVSIGTGARDGADFYVPGGTGVDSKVVQVPVSPGESVHVRTPGQRNAATSSNGSVSNITMNVVASDADSFGASQDQIQAKLLRGMRRAGRRG